MSMLLLYRPYRWRLGGADGGGAGGRSRKKRDTVVFKIPKPSNRRVKHTLKPKSTPPPVAADWSNWLESAFKSAKDSAKKIPGNLPDVSSLIARVEGILRSVVIVPDGALLSLEGPDPELLAWLSFISHQLEVFASDEEAVLLFMLQRRR